MTEILKCLMLPDVEPVVRLMLSGHLTVVVRSTRLYAEGPLAPSREEAIAAWNARMQPLHDLKAERERQAARIAELEAQVAFLQGGLHKNDDTVKWVRKPIPRSGDAP